jgi:hypothetical protein
MIPSPSFLDEQSLAIGIIELSDAVDLRRILGY